MRLSKILLPLLVPASALAQAPGAPSLRPVDVIGNYDTSVGSSDAASQGSVNSSLIVNRPLLRTGELLEFVPGLIVTQHSGDGKANQYFLRGFNLDHGTDFATFVDGMPVNMRSHAHGQGYTDLNFLIPELVERIDYRKGPYFAQEGDFASAGSARLKLIDRLPQGIASLTLGRFGFRRGVLADSVDLADGALLYALDLGHNDGPWQVPERQRKALGTLRYSSGHADHGHSLTLMSYSARWTATDQIPLRAVQSGALDRFGSLDPSDGGDTARWSLSYALRQRNAWGAFALNAYAIASRLDLFSNFTYFLDNPVEGDQFQQSERRRLFGLDLSQTLNGRLAGRDMVNKIGLQTRFDRLSPVGLYSSAGRQRLATTREDRVRQASAGVYWENVVQWSDKLRSIAGLRHDQHRFAVDSSIAANSGRERDGITSPKLSLVFGPWAKTEYFVNYGEGFHSNDARGTTASVSPKTGDAIDRVTPLVKTRGAELGVRTEIIPGLQSSLALWRLHIGSELLFIGDAGDTEASRPSRRSGIEWNNHYVANRWLQFDADLALSRTRFADADPAGRFIPGSIEKVASLGVTVSDYRRWSGGLQLRYFGPRPLIEDNSVRSKATTLLNARVAYQIDPRTRLSLDVFNLLNRKASDIDYFYGSRLRGEPDAVDDIHFHPVEPRNLRLTLSHRF